MLLMPKLKGDVIMFIRGYNAHQKLNFDGLYSTYFPDGVRHKFVTPIDLILFKNELSKFKLV